MAGRVIAEYGQTMVLRILAIVILLPVAFALSDISSFISISCVLLIILVWVAAFKSKIILYPNRLIKKGLFSNKTVNINSRTEFYYRVVQEHINGIAAGKHTYIILRSGNDVIKANSNIKHVEQLKEQLIQLELQYIQPRVQEALTQRSSLTFGALKVSPTGLAYKNKMVTYQEIEDFQLMNGFFKVKKVGQHLNFLNIAVAEIPNMTTFFTLLDHYMQQKLS